ncbi:hypothetical protein O3P69_015128 [Scylla paramamosain]
MELLLDHLGMGRWSLLHISAGMLGQALGSMQALSGAFMAPMLNYTCRLPTLASPLHNMSVPPETFHRIPGDECSFIVNGLHGEEQRPCTEWDFDNSSFASTITSEFLLVCGRTYLAPLHQSLYMIGSSIGAIFGGILSDKFGRRLIIILGLTLFLMIAACSSWLPNLSLIFIARFCIGFIYVTYIQSVYVIVMETVPSWMRATMGILVAVGWALFTIVFGGLGYMLREWRELQMVSSLPFLLVVPLLLLLDESPHWLMVQGKEEAVLKVVTRAAALHKVDLPSDSVDKLMKEINSMKKNKTKENQTQVWQQLKNKVLRMLVLFRTPQLRCRTLVMCFDFFTASVVFFSLCLGAVNLSADPYIYMALSGLVEIPSYFLMGPLVARMGRKGPAIGSFLFAGITILVLPAIPSGLWQVNMAMALLSKMAISGVLIELFLYSSEIFPTEIRIQGLGTGMFLSRVGSIISPFFNDLLVPLFPMAMPLGVGGMCIIAGLLTLLLPETKGAKLPDLIEEVEGK